MSDSAKVFKLKQRLQVAQKTIQDQAGKIKGFEQQDSVAREADLKAKNTSLRREISGLETQLKTVVHEVVVTKKELRLAREARDEARDRISELEVEACPESDVPVEKSSP